MSNCKRISHFCQSQYCSFHKVMRIRRALTLCKNVGYTHTLKYSTHSSSSLYSCSCHCRLKKYLSTTITCSLLMWYCSFMYRNLDKVFLSCFNTVRNCCCNLTCFSWSPAYYAILVTYHYHGS